MYLRRVLTVFPERKEIEKIGKTELNKLFWTVCHMDGVIKSMFKDFNFETITFKNP